MAAAVDGWRLRLGIDPVTAVRVASDSVPAAKMGVYMGIFNFFIVIPQPLAASVLGFLLKTFFGSAPINALLIGGMSLLLAGLCTLRVKEVSNAAH
jgi:maltose/moltooligosaccharide transporter